MARLVLEEVGEVVASGQLHGGCRGVNEPEASSSLLPGEIDRSAFLPATAHAR
jgi:hypothetical protein